MVSRSTLKNRGALAALSAAAAIGLALSAPGPADAQFPELPSLPGLPGGPAPLPAQPELPVLPPPVAQPPKPLPQVPSVPAEVPGLEGVQLPPELAGRDVVPRKIGGFDFEPPGPIPGMLTPTGETYTVESDSTRLLGNVKMSYVQIDTLQGTKPAIRIDADRVVLDNLRVRFPGTAPGVEDVWQRSGPGVETTLNDHFHIIVGKMTITPQVAGVTLPIPITIDASWAPERVQAELSKAGAGLPDEMSNLMAVIDGTMETYYISADNLVAEQGMSIKP